MIRVPTAETSSGDGITSANCTPPIPAAPVMNVKNLFVMIGRLSFCNYSNTFSDLKGNIIPEILEALVYFINSVSPGAGVKPNTSIYACVMLNELEDVVIKLISRYFEPGLLTLALNRVVRNKMINS